MAEQISSIAPENIAIPKISQSEVRPSAETGNTSGGGNAPENRAPVIPANSGNSTLIEEQIKISNPATLDDVMDVAPTQPTILNGAAGDSAKQEDSLLKRLSNK